MKSIFKRVLVGVLVALILSFIRGNLFIGVKAMELTSQNVTASSHRYNDNVSSVNLINRSLFGINFCGAEYSNATGRVTYNTTNNLSTSKNYDVSFFIYQSNTGERGNSPVVTYNDNMCTVVPFGTLVTYNETTNLPMFDNFGGWAAPGAVTGGGIQSFNDYLKMHPDLNYTSKGYLIYCSDVNIKSLNQIKVYTSQAGCGQSPCFYGLGTDLYYKQSKDSVLIDNQNSNTEKITDEQKKTTQSIDNVNNSINNDDTSSAETKGNDFFGNFQSNGHGLSGIITSPLRLLNSLTTATCTPLTFQLPILHNQVSLACMKSIYEDKFGFFFSLWQLITTGLISYHVCINLYSKVRNLQNPKNDRIEVLNL